MKNLLYALSLLVFLSCGKKDKEYKSLSNEKDLKSVVVEESIPAGTYAYLKVGEEGESYWIAVMQEEFEIGETLYFNSFMEVRDFNSKELDRTFESILFVDKVSRDPDQVDIFSQSKDASSEPRENPMDVLIDSIKIDPAPGGLSIAELYGTADKYKDKEVIVRGQIIKINRDIMDKNWVHIMDGTRVDRSDLTFTTKDDFQVGDTITIRGKVAVDKDFGAGYVYPLIVEDAELVK